MTSDREPLSLTQGATQLRGAGFGSRADVPTHHHQELSMTDRLTKQDPRAQYPRPPFPKQPQPVPGLAAKMDPKPDHGEDSYKGSGKLIGRKALVTGGDSGIGRAAAIAFAREGADVAIVYLPDEESDAKEVIALIEADGRKAVALPGDITDESFCKALVTDAVESLGGIDILVVNAGRQQNREDISKVSSEDFDKTLKTNLYALHWIAQAAVPHLEAGASIITTSSIQAYEPSAILLDYATTKAGIVAYTKALAKQMIEKGIRANVVAPGPFWTALQSSGGQPPEAVMKFGEESAYGRPGQPVEIAPIYVLLASQEGSFISGEVYGVTGGAGIA
jgi:NAD(P)-dependent dehydrogenase (short-subunit alcohol dehydrogenase family)